MKKKPTIAELEKLLNTPDDRPITISPTGRVVYGKKAKEKIPILTADEHIGDEY